MRSAISSAFLIAALAAVPACAQPSGWVDPPAKGAAKTDDEPGEPKVKPQAESTERPAAQPAKTARAPSVPRAKSAEARRARQTPAASQAAAGPAPSDREGAAERLVTAYLGSVSAPGAGMVAAAPRFYGERVRFHGQVMNLSALMAEKSRFARRWPERRYAPRGAMQSSCEGAICTVRTVFDFRAENRARTALSLGVGELTLTIDVSDERPRIVSESSRVLRYGGQVVGEAARPGRGA